MFSLDRQYFFITQVSRNGNIVFSTVVWQLHVVCWRRHLKFYVKRIFEVDLHIHSFDFLQTIGNATLPQLTLVVQDLRHHLDCSLLLSTTSTLLVSHLSLSNTFWMLFIATFVSASECHFSQALCAPVEYRVHYHSGKSLFVKAVVEVFCGHVSVDHFIIVGVVRPWNLRTWSRHYPERIYITNCFNSIRTSKHCHTIRNQVTENQSLRVNVTAYVNAWYCSHTPMRR